MATVHPFSVTTYPYQGYGWLEPIPAGTGLWASYNMHHRAHRDKQPPAFTFTLLDCLWTVGGSRRTRREPTQALGYCVRYKVQDKLYIFDAGGPSNSLQRTVKSNTLSHCPHRVIDQYVSLNKLLTSEYMDLSVRMIWEWNKIKGTYGVCKCIS